MIYLFTDFSFEGPYVGQMKAVISGIAPAIQVLDLMHDAPQYQPAAGARLLAASLRAIPKPEAIVAVVDPGVGSARRPIAIKAGGTWLVGPDNGLLIPAARFLEQDEPLTAFEITWKPATLSATFHGRDLFAPTAARLAKGRPVEMKGIPVESLHDWEGPGTHPYIIYIDAYGNCITGLTQADLPDGDTLVLNSKPLPWQTTFSDVAKGQAFCYENALGLVEIAVNQGSAADKFSLKVGNPVTLKSAEA